MDIDYGLRKAKAENERSLTKLSQDVVKGLVAIGYKVNGGGETLTLLDDPEGNTVKVHPDIMSPAVRVRYSFHKEINDK